MNQLKSRLNVIRPNWSVPEKVKAFSTTRQGGVSLAPWGSMNLALHVHDNSENVNKNRMLLKQEMQLPNEPSWLEQVHSDKVIQLTQQNHNQNFKADATYTTEKNIICCVMTADCLPVLFCNKQATWVAAVHAGWKGIANGILKKLVQKYVSEFDGQMEDIRVWIGPAISAKAYQVGQDVKNAFIEQDAILEKAFTSQQADHFLLDSSYAAQLQLNELGVKVEQITTEDFCTYKDKERFFSYRRDGANTGRMATMVWLS